jgi:hypothetical protein
MMAANATYNVDNAGFFTPKNICAKHWDLVK